MTQYSRFEDIPLFSYDLIMSDCPWSFSTWSNKGKGKSADRHYGCMSLDDIKALPVGSLAASHAVLFHWCTWPMLREGIEVVSAWGFKYVTGGAWHKMTAHGKTAFGTGYRVRCASEPFLLGVVGNPKNSRSERNIITGLVREHSRKPEEAFAWCERYLPGARRLELFSRTARPGWDAWGNEAGKFNAMENADDQTIS